MANDMTTMIKWYKDLIEENKGYNVSIVMIDEQAFSSQIPNVKITNKDGSKIGKWGKNAKAPWIENRQNGIDLMLSLNELFKNDDNVETTYIMQDWSKCERYVKICKKDMLAKKESFLKEFFQYGVKSRYDKKMYQNRMDEEAKNMIERTPTH